LTTNFRLGPSNADKLIGRLRDPHSPLSTLQLFRFGGLFGIDAPRAAKGEAIAATCGLVAFGFRASLLPRRWDLAIVFSFGGVRRRNSDPCVAPGPSSIAGAEARPGRRISRLSRNIHSSPTPVASAAKSRTSTHRQYIDSRGEETRTTFCPHPNVRRRFRGEFSEQNPLGAYGFLRSTLSLIHTVGEAPAVRESVASAAERLVRRGFARKGPVERRPPDWREDLPMIALEIHHRTTYR